MSVTYIGLALVLSTISFRLGMVAGRKYLKKYLNREGYNIVIDRSNKIGYGRYVVIVTPLGEEPKRSYLH
jgi:hypothetical protein